MQKLCERLSCTRNQIERTIYYAQAKMQKNSQLMDQKFFDIIPARSRKYRVTKGLIDQFEKFDRCGEVKDDNKKYHTQALIESYKIKKKEQKREKIEQRKHKQ